MSILEKVFPPPVPGAKPCEGCGRLPRSEWEQRQQGTCSLCGKFLGVECWGEKCPNGTEPDFEHDETAPPEMGDPY